MSNEKLDITEAVSLLNQSAENIEDEVKSRDFSDKELEELKGAEEGSQDREEVVKLFEREIKRSKVSTELSAAEKDVEDLEKALKRVQDIEDLDYTNSGFDKLDSEDIIDLMAGSVSEMEDFLEKHRPKKEGLKKLLEAERKINDREEAISLIKRTINREELEKDMEEAEENIEELEKDINRLQSHSEQTEPPAEEDNETDNEETDETSEEKSQEENDEDEDAENKEDDISEDLKEKREVAASLDGDFSDSDLQNISLDELKKIRDEKEERDEIISFLKSEGMDEEGLREASTEDLKKINSELRDQSDEEAETSEITETSDDEDEKSQEEIKEEAEEDLQMLMGAGKGEDEEEEEDSSNKLSDMKDKLKSRIESDEEEGEEASQDLDEKKLEDVLSEYRELDREEAVVKTAHIMKGYLERELGIKKELTYSELAERIPEDTESLENIASSFNKLNKQQYTQKIDIERDEFIDNCKEAVKSLER